MEVIPRSLVVFWIFFGILCLLPLGVVFFKYGEASSKAGAKKTAGRS